MLAHLAVAALFGIYHWAEHREAGEEAQGGAHRADGVAIGASAAPGQHHDRYQRDSGHDKGRQAAHPDLLAVKSITVGALCDGGQQVVDPDIYGLEEILDDAAPRAVGCQQRHEGLYADNQSGYEHDPHDVAEPLFLGAETIRLVVLAAAFACHRDVCHTILEYTQRAYHGAVYAAEYQSENYQGGDDRHVECQHGGQELDLGHPAEPEVQRAGEIEQHQGDAREEYGSENYSDFSKHLVSLIKC